MTSPPTTAKPPLPQNFNYYVLLETLGSKTDADQARLEELLAIALEKELIADAALANSEADLSWFWNIREDVKVLKEQTKFDQHFDISLPIPLIGKFVDQRNIELAQIPEVKQIFTFGHIADGNIHFIIGKESNNPTLTEAINQVIYTPLKELGGSVSAEHGIGTDKKAYLHLCRSPEEIALMRTIKTALDSKGILNNGKIF